MKVETYKETYHNPITQIPVPAEFQMGNFDVLFIKNLSSESKPKAKRKPNPALKGLGMMHDDLIAPTTDIGDWELD